MILEGERVLVLCWCDHKQVVLPGRAVAVDDTHVLFEIDPAAIGEDGDHGRWRFQYPHTAENVTWGRAGQTNAAALMSAYALGTLSLLPSGPTGTQGPRISAVWL